VTVHVDQARRQRGARAGYHVCAGGLRRFLRRRDALPDKPLVALIPISVRCEVDAGELHNRVSGTVVEIATDERDPGERLARIHQELADAPQVRDAIPAADVIQNLAEFSAPAVAAQASRMVASLRVADRSRPPFNLTITNVAGPRERLYTARGELKTLLPALPVSEGIGLSITAVSYRERVDVCLVSCRELVPELDELADDLVAAFEELRDAPLEPKKKRKRKRRSRPLDTGPGASA